MRLIDVDALICRWKAAMLHMTTVVDGKHPISIETIIEDVEVFPAIDPESLRPQGEWLKREDDYCSLTIIKCSLCREEWCFEVDADAGILNYHYCPNCGAKMKGE